MIRIIGLGILFAVTLFVSGCSSPEPTVKPDASQPVNQELPKKPGEAPKTGGAIPPDPMPAPPGVKTGIVPPGGDQSSGK